MHLLPKQPPTQKFTYLLIYQITHPAVKENLR